MKAIVSRFQSIFCNTILGLDSKLEHPLYSFVFFAPKEMKFKVLPMPALSLLPLCQHCLYCRSVSYTASSITWTFTH
ncbi:hypothetical protein Sjap_025223 [Stephania japonica]|uniref:Uncharacterized protein n=1 Tax=Stephania japonica TaxID=461633 RepID=A0AAP0E5S1_9MAGN